MENNESDIQKKDKVHVLQDITLSPVQAKSLKDHMKLLYPNLKRIRTKVDMEFPNCDVYLFRIPTGVDPFLLLNKEINLEENCKLKLEKKYVIESTTKLPEARLFVSDNSRVLNLRKNFMMTRYVKVKKQPQISVGKQSNIKLPENFEGRQQPFSPSFEDKIYLSEEVEKKLDKAIANIMKRKIKKKKVRIIEQVEDHHQNEEIYDLLNEQNPSAAKINTKVSDDSAISSCSSSINSKEKNKEDNESLLIKLLENTKQEVQTSYETEAESKIPKKKKKNKKYNESWLIKSLESTKQELETSYETEAETKVRKKKKKSKKVEDIDVSSVETINKDVDNHTPQRKKIKSIVNSTLSLDAYGISSSSPNLSLITSDTSDVAKKEKRKQKHSFEEESANSRTSNILDDISSDVSLPKKVKKKKKDRTLDY